MLNKHLTALLLTGSMAIRLAMLVLAAGLLLAGLTAPASAGGTAGSVSQYPVLDGDVAVRQAYMGWLAVKQETGMDAAIRYITSINGSTEKLATLREEFHVTAAGIPSYGSPEGLLSVLKDLRDLTRRFREESRIQLDAAHGSAVELAAAIHDSTDSDTRSRMSEDEYWMTRMVSEPSSLDRYIRESQATLFTLQEHGYEVNTAQEKLDQIAAMRSGYTAALQSKDYDGAEIIREKIHDASVRFEGTVKDIGIKENATAPCPASGTSQGTA